MKTPHTSTFKGKRVFIRMKNGDFIIGKFQDKKQRFVILKEDLKIGYTFVAIEAIKSFSINKNKTT